MTPFNPLGDTQYSELCTLIQIFEDISTCQPLAYLFMQLIMFFRQYPANYLNFSHVVTEQ